MNQIKNYIEAMFSGLPKTQNVVEMKLTMLENMQEKFEALLNEGRNENEALGIVFSDFGNIEELKEELGIIGEAPYNAAAAETTEDAALKEEFYAFKKKFGIAIAIAVTFFILSPPLYLLVESSVNDTMAIFSFFLAIACGTGICIYFGIQDEKYKQLLRIGNAPPTAAESPITSLISAIVFPLATIVYLIMGFLWNLWHPGWIVFLAAAMLVGISKAIAAFKGNK